MLNASEHKKFCEAMHKALNKRGMTRKDLANEIGVAEKSIFNFECDTTRNPSKFLAAKIANHLDIKKKDYKSGGAFFLIPLIIASTILPIKTLAGEPEEIVIPVIEQVREIDHKAIEEEVFGVDYDTDFVPGYYEAPNEPVIDYDLPLSVELQEGIQEICANKDISYELVLSIVEAESRYTIDAHNPNGYYGLMQLGNWAINHYGVSDPYDPLENIDAGTEYLKDLYEEYEDDGLVLDYYSGNPYAETNYNNGKLSKYAKKILERSAELEEQHNK